MQSGNSAQYLLLLCIQHCSCFSLAGITWRAAFHPIVVHGTSLRCCLYFDHRAKVRLGFNIKDKW